MAQQMGYTPCWLYTSSLMCSPFISLKYAAKNYCSVETHTQFSQKSHQGWKEVLIISTSVAATWLKVSLIAVAGHIHDWLS